jgi:hypothetical protein
MAKGVLLAPSLVALPLFGCGDRSAMPYLGKWSGGYTVETAGKGSVGGPARNGLKGFLQLYRTESRYELHLEGEQFGLVAGGTWSQKEGRVNLAPKEVKIDDGGGQEARNPNRAWIEPATLREAYARPMALRLSKDGQRLTGLLTEVGPLTGTHSFVREGFGR